VAEPDDEAAEAETPETPEPEAASEPASELPAEQE
jgi:hypothetical protein